MRKRRIKKNFWFDEDEDNSLKNLSKLSGKTEVQVIRKLITGATIKDLSRYTKELDTRRVEKTLKGIDDLRLRITEKYIK